MPRKVLEWGPSLSSSACTQQTQRLWTKDEHWVLTCEMRRVIHTWRGGRFEGKKTLSREQPALCAHPADAQHRGTAPDAQMCRQ